MKLVGICPTYQRPNYLSNLLWCFQQQDYADKHLLILDDAGQYYYQGDKDWVLHTERERYQNLAQKYSVLCNVAMQAFGHCIIVVMEDDDIYLPNHFRNTAAAFTPGVDYVMPNVVGAVNYLEPGYSINTATTNYHGAWAYDSKFYKKIGGYTYEHGAMHDNVIRDKMRHGRLQRTTELSYVYRCHDDHYQGSKLNQVMTGDPTFIGFLNAKPDELTERMVSEWNRQK